MSDVANYIIVHYDEVWVVSLGDRLLAGFPSRNDAEYMVHLEVEARCSEGKGTRVIIEDGLQRQVLHPRCFAGTPPNTPLH